MAKKDAQPAAAAAANVTTTVDNVMDEIRSGNLMNDIINEKAEAEIKDEEEKRKIRILKDAKMKSRYLNRKALLNLRARRREEKATKAYLEKTQSLMNELAEGKITPNEYDTKISEAYNDSRKTIKESNEQLEKEKQELRSSCGSYWCWDWDDNDPSKLLR